jgi:Arm DNA-binding domain
MRTSILAAALARSEQPHFDKRTRLYTSDRDAETAKPGAKPYRMRFGNQLYLWVTPAGTKSWQVHYKDADNKHQATVVGRWPAMRLTEAEHKRDILHYHKPRIDPQGDRRRAVADKALMQAFAKWRPSKRERRYLDETLVQAFSSWRATR